jgi:hypothetical protein
MPWLSTSCSTISRRLNASLGCVLLVRGLLRWTGIKWRSLQENVAVAQHVCCNADIYSRKRETEIVCKCVWETEKVGLDVKLLCISIRL